MSPEQITGGDVDHRSDIFSLRIVLCEMITGVRPFSGQSHAELASAILRDVPRPLEASNIRRLQQPYTDVNGCSDREKHNELQLRPFEPRR